MNLAAFDNLKRVLLTVPAGELRMDQWDRCAIGYATHDAWFQQRGLQGSFKSASRVFDVRCSEALSLFSLKAGRTPDQVIATIDRFIASRHPNKADAHARRQAVINQMLKSALKAERAVRRSVNSMLGMVGL